MQTLESGILQASPLKSHLQKAMWSTRCYKPQMVGNLLNSPENSMVMSLCACCFILRRLSVLDLYSDSVVSVSWHYMSDETSLVSKKVCWQQQCHGTHLSNNSWDFLSCIFFQKEISTDVSLGRLEVLTLFYLGTWGRWWWWWRWKY